MSDHFLILPMNHFSQKSLKYNYSNTCSTVVYQKVWHKTTIPLFIPFGQITNSSLEIKLRKSRIQTTMPGRNPNIRMSCLTQPNPLTTRRPPKIALHPSQIKGDITEDKAEKIAGQCQDLPMYRRNLNQPK